MYVCMYVGMYVCRYVGMYVEYIPCVVAMTVPLIDDMLYIYIYIYMCVCMMFVQYIRNSGGKNLACRIIDDSQPD